MTKARAEREGLWAEEILRWEGSQQSALAYCRERNLKVSTFGYWKRRLRPVELGKAIEKGGFRPISVIPDPVPAELFFRAGGFEVLIRSST